MFQALSGTVPLSCSPDREDPVRRFPDNQPGPESGVRGRAAWLSVQDVGCRVQDLVGSFHRDTHKKEPQFRETASWEGFMEVWGLGSNGGCLRPLLAETAAPSPRGKLCA